MCCNIFLVPQPNRTKACWKLSIRRWLGVFITLLYINPNIYYWPVCCYTPTWGQTCPREFWQKIDIFPDLRQEACQHVVVEVSLTPLQACCECLSLNIYIHTLPNKHHCSFYMMPWPHLIAKCKLDFKILILSKAKNLPTWGCKSMMEGPTIMLGVFKNLLYTHTMPNIYYCSTCMLLYHHLMAKLVWELA